MRLLQLLAIVLAATLAGCTTTAHVRSDPGTGPSPGTAEAPVTGAAPASVSPWETARANNIGFRAIGNEPGWSVEVERGATPTLYISLQYAQRTLEVPASQPFAEPQAGVAGFRGQADGVQVELRITRGHCQDTMSGEQFDASAELRVGSERFLGCGRFLF